MKTFYIETFGCQMNAHDSEKVIGHAARSRATRKSIRPKPPNYVFYNTCSIRDKAEQKVFQPPAAVQARRGQGQGFRRDRLRGAAGRRKIFEKAPHVSLVAGSASYTKLPEMLVQLEAGNRRVTGLSLDTDETFDTPFTRRDNPHRAYITIIEGCDKSCAYCVVPFTRGPERSRTSASVIAEAQALADAGYTEIQLLGQNVNSYRDPSPAAGTSPRCSTRGQIAGHSPRPLHHFASARFRKEHHRRDRRESERFATTCICRCSRDRRAS